MLAPSATEAAEKTVQNWRIAERESLSG